MSVHQAIIRALATVRNTKPKASISGVLENLGNVVIAAYSTTTISHIFRMADGTACVPVFAYIVSSGWAGMVCQGTHINPSTGEVTFTMYNSLSTQVTGSILATALIFTA